MSGIASGDLAICVCDRCRIKFPYHELRPDGNSPKLMVCRECWDSKDPYRLPARQTEEVAMKHPRPDTPTASGSNYLLSSDGTFIIASDDGTYIRTS